MKNIKKLKSYGKAIAGSALLVGATLTGAAGLASAQSGSSGDATLADYPHPFVDDEGNLDSTVVVGTDGKQADVVSAIDIAGNLGNNAFSSETVESSAGAVDGEQEEDTIRDTIDISIDASDYSAFTRETVEDEDGDDVFVTESADFSGSSNVNGTDAEIAFDEGDISYSIKYSPGFSQGDDITLLGEEYELVEIVDTGEVKLGSTLEQSLTVGEDYTHGPYTVEVTGRSSGDNPEAVVRVSSEEETLETRALETDEAIELENDQEVDDTEFTVNATSVIFYEDGTSEVSLESTVQDTTLEEGEDLPMDDRYEVNTLGVNSEENRLSEIKTSNRVQTVDEPEDDEEDETAHLETGDSYTGPSDYFTLTNQGLSNEATGEIEIEEDYEVTYEDSNNFEHSIDLRELVTGGSAQLFNFADGTASSPTMFINEGNDGAGDDANSADTTGYDDGDDILRFTRLVDKGTDFDGKTLSDFSSSEYYISPSGASFTGSQAIVDDSSGPGTLDASSKIVKDGTASVLSDFASKYAHYDDSSGTTDAYDTNTNDYGEAIYDESSGSTGSQVDASDYRVSSVTVNSGTSDSDLTTIGLGYSTGVEVNTGNNDAGVSVSDIPNNAGGQISVIDAEGDPGLQSDDVVFIDTDANGQYDSEVDILLHDGGDAFSDNDPRDETLSGTWKYGETGSADAVFFDVGTNDGADGTNGDNDLTLDVDAGTSTVQTLDSQGYTIDGTTTTTPLVYYDVPGSASSGSYDTDDSVYVDVTNAGIVDAGDTSSSGDNGDVRLKGFTASYGSQTSVSSGDLDTGVSLSTNWNSNAEKYLDDNDNGEYDNGEAIIDSAGNNALESGDTVEVTGSISGSSQSFTPGTEMFVGSSTSYDGTQDVVDVTVETTGDTSATLDGATLNNFGSLIKHTDSSGTYSNSATIVEDSDDNGVYNSGSDTVLKGSEPSGAGGILSADDSDKTIYTDISGYPLEIEWDSGSQEATLTYEEFEETVAVGDSQQTFETGYGFSFDASFNTDPDSDSTDELVITGTDRTLETEEDAKISFSSDEVTVTEENSETITVEYDGSDQLDRISFSGDPSDLTDTDDGDSTLTGFGSAVELDSDSSATVTYPDEPLEQLSAFGSIGEGTGEGSVMSPTGWASGSAATDEEASTDQNLVLVGGPLVNDLTGDLADQGSTWNSSEYESNQGVGVLDLVNDAFDGNTALVVAGWQADDTSAAAEYLVENAGAQELEGRSTVQVDTESGELLQ